MLTVWAQNVNSIKRLLVLQKKSLQIMYFVKRNTHTSNLFKNLNLLKLLDKVSLESCILLCNCFNQSLPKSSFTLATASNTHNNWGLLKIPSHKTKTKGRHSINVTAIYTWNYFQKLNVNSLFYQLPLTNLKTLIKKLYTSNYN